MNAGRFDLAVQKFFFKTKPGFAQSPDDGKEYSRDGPGLVSMSPAKMRVMSSCEYKFHFFVLNQQNGRGKMGCFHLSFCGRLRNRKFSSHWWGADSFLLMDACFSFFLTSIPVPCPTLPQLFARQNFFQKGTLILWGSMWKDSPRRGLTETEPSIWWPEIRFSSASACAGRSSQSASGTAPHQSSYKRFEGVKMDSCSLENAPNWRIHCFLWWNLTTGVVRLREKKRKRQGLHDTLRKRRKQENFSYLEIRFRQPFWKSLPNLEKMKRAGVILRTNVRSSGDNNCSQRYWSEILHSNSLSCGLVDPSRLIFLFYIFETAIFPLVDFFFDKNTGLNVHCKICYWRSGRKERKEWKNKNEQHRDPIRETFFQKYCFLLVDNKPAEATSDKTLVFGQELNNSNWIRNTFASVPGVPRCRLSSQKQDAPDGEDEVGQERSFKAQKGEK